MFIVIEHLCLALLKCLLAHFPAKMFIFSYLQKSSMFAINHKNFPNIYLTFNILLSQFYMIKLMNILLHVLFTSFVCHCNLFKTKTNNNKPTALISKEIKDALFGSQI